MKRDYVHCMICCCFGVSSWSHLAVVDSLTCLASEAFVPLACARHHQKLTKKRFGVKGCRHGWSARVQLCSWKPCALLTALSASRRPQTTMCDAFYFHRDKVMHWHSLLARVTRAPRGMRWSPGEWRCPSLASGCSGESCKTSIQ